MVNDPILIRPDDEGKDLVPAAKIALKQGNFSVPFNKFAPVLGIIKVGLGNFSGQAAAGYLAKSGKAIKIISVRIDKFQLVIVMLVRVLVGRGVGGIVHAGAEIGVVKDLILMI